MITHLRGTLVHKSPTAAVVDVNGVGYGLAVSLNTYEQLPECDAPVQLFTHTYVREDRLELFGFTDAIEREMFELLIGVSGIGPNLAQTILSGMSVRELQQAILGGAVQTLTGVRGIGRKTADRVVLELRDRIPSTGVAPAATGEPAGAEADVGVEQEAVLALVALGMQMAGAKKAVEKAAARKTEETATLQGLIKQALHE